MPEALLNSLLLSAGVALVATLLGAPLGYLLARRGGVLQKVFLFLLAAPLAVPPYVLAMAWIQVLGRNGWLGQLLGESFAGPANLGLYSLPGAVAVMALGGYPLPLLATYAGTRALDPRIEEAARLAGGRRAALLRVTLPLLLPAVSAGGGLVALLTLLAFAVPSLLQTPVYTFEIYSRFATGASLGEAARYATLLVALGAMAGAAWLYWMGRQIRRVEAGSPATPRGRFGAVEGVYVSVFIGIVVFCPVGLLLQQARPLANVAAVWGSAREELGTSILLAASAASAGLAAGLLLALGSLRRGGGVLWLSAVPYLVSGPVLGIALIHLFNAPGWRGAVYDSFGIMVIACVARYTIFAHAGLYAALRLRARAPEDAAATLGAGRWRRLLRVVLPGIMPWLGGLWFLLFLLCFGELDAVLLVAPPGWTPLSVRLFSLMHYGPGGLVYALSLLAAAVTLGGAAAGGALGYALHRRHRGPRT